LILKDEKRNKEILEPNFLLHMPPPCTMAQLQYISILLNFNFFFKKKETKLMSKISRHLYIFGYVMIVENI